ncbi:B-block binding subunit of TFIIIC [Kalmanozyma brasiliensis GHG001]|uniref:B-block binding subunit of TFIIIC n=1 Tax=Kalmanozyma brasiliensis (strain GHG001) TaxID=1365824 RepID=UPI002867B20D|nr:B-block binding subunit of TFIIIC [Kalmanozyma brasiliensis GHG001]EST09115.2 B-block binding subunit of TFIIIC [Kalmanozyma brasiliensis GHG001]
MIDELIHFCIEQIGLDGDAGTDINRFADFIRQYHTEHSSRSQLPNQLVDEYYQAFVFRQLLRHPDVSVGLFIPGVPVKGGAKTGILKRKASTLDSPAPGTKVEAASAPSQEFDWVDLLPDQVLAEQQGLAQLQQLHADHLRLVLQPSEIKRLIVGANADALTATGYRALQIICRSRETPVLSTDIGAALHTDQKTVFYICKRLIDLHLIIKIKARETGTVASYFLATQFEDQCDILIQQRKADNAADLQQSGLADPSTSQASASALPKSSNDQTELMDEDAEDDPDDRADLDTERSAPTVFVKAEESQDVFDTAAHTASSAQSNAPAFDYVEPAQALLWINSRPELVRFRIYLLCNATSSRVTFRYTLLHRINLAQTRPQRRAFHVLLEHAVVDGFLEVVNVVIPSTGGSHRGLRMTAKGLAEMHDLLRGDYGDASLLQEQVKAARLNAKLQQDLDRIGPAMPRELTLERHVYEQIAHAGPAGRTISQLLSQLHGGGHFARALDQLVQRAEDADGEPAMSDMRVRGFHEHKLRVRSTKLYSHHSWVLQSANDGFLDPDDLQLLASAGGSTSYHRRSTAWTSADQIGPHLATLGTDLYPSTPGAGAPRIGRPPKNRDPDAPPPKRGRPRKHPLPDPDTPAPPPKKKGRPPKKPPESVEASPVDADAAPSSVVSSSRRSLRPRKTRQAKLVDADSEEENPVDLSMDEVSTSVMPESPAAGASKRRSRRVLQGPEQTGPSSMLASSPVSPSSPIEAPTHAPEELAEALVEQAIIPQPSDASAPATEKAAEQEVPQNGTQTSALTDEGVAAAKAPTVDVSRVSDLLDVPSQVKAEATLPPTPAAKKLSSSTATPSASERKRRTNLTQLRSSYALVQCVREAGGAMDSLQIPDQLSDYVERHGFSSDAQLTNLRDRKVREKALVAAVDNNLLRRTFIRLDLPTAPLPRRQIIYLPHLTPEQLQKYCQAVKEGRDGWFESKNAKTALTHATNDVAVDLDDALRFAKPWHLTEPLRLAEVSTDTSQLSTLRKPFLDVVSVYRQHLGFLAGEMVRLKAFHLACAKFITLCRSASSGPDDAGSLSLSFFWTDAPLDLFLALVPTPAVSETIESMTLDPQVRSLPVRALSEELKLSLGLTERVADDVRISLYSLATQLSDLGLVELQPAGAVEDQRDGRPDTFNTAIEPRRYLPLYDWTSEEENKSLIGFVEAGLDATLINRFWAKTQARCLNVQKKFGTEGRQDHGVLTLEDAARLASPVEAEAHKTVPEELSNVLFYGKAWRPYHQLRPSQQKYLLRVDVQDIPSATQDDLERLAYITLAPTQIVRAALQYRLRLATEPVDPDAPVVRHKSPHFSWPLKLSTISLPTSVYRPMAVQAEEARPAQPRVKTQAEREREGRLTTYNKARELRERRNQHFQAMLDDAVQATPAAHELRAKIETALEVIRRKFVTGDIKFDANAVQMAIARAIRSASGVRVMPSVRASSAGRKRRRERVTSTGQDQESGDESDPQRQDGEDAHDRVARANGKRDRRGRRHFDQTSFWTPAKKELLRDAAVILRMRDQVRGRSDWSALFQVMDREDLTKTRAVIMAQWRSQYYRMRSLHGEEAYLTALESRWVPVYLEAQEAGTLDDPEFPSPTEFDLVAQIELLRDKIDKDEVQSSLTKPVARYHLPLTLGASADFTTSWKEEFEEEPVEQRFEAFFPTDFSGAMTKRFETLLHMSFGEEQSIAERWKERDIEKQMAEWAVRVVIVSADAEMAPQDDATTQVAPSPVDEKIKAEFCKSMGDTQIEEAMQRLLDIKLIRCTAVDPIVRRRPGTNFVLTEELQKLLPDANADNRMAAMDLQATLTHRKSAFQQVTEAKDGVVVEPVEADGEAAAMVPLLASELMAGEVDVRAFDTLRQSAAFNARVLNDDDLEALITIKDASGMMEALETAVVPLPAVPSDEALDWLKAAANDGDGGPRPLRPVVETMVGIWRLRFQDCVRDLSATDAQAAERVQDFGLQLIQSGAQGLAVDRPSHRLSRTDIVTLTRGPLPLAFFSPLTSTPVLIASIFVGAYTLTIPVRSEFTPRLSLPHIWTTLSSHSRTQWRALLDTIVALVFQRPATRLASLTSRFTSTAVTEDGEKREVVGTSFADVWAAVTALVEAEVVEVYAEGEVELWTVHPGKRVVWAGFR